MRVSTGKEIRFRRLIDQKSGAMLIVPMDHGYTLGPVKGIDQPAHTVEQVFAGGASTVVVHKGLVKSLTRAIPPHGGLMIHVSGSTSLSPKSDLKILTSSVPEVITLGADGISCHVNISSDEDYLMLEDTAKLTEEASDFGLPLLAMMYVRNSDGIEKNDVDSIAHAARIAEEIGADIVKVNATKGGEGFDHVVQGVNIPVVIAGGAKTNDFSSFLESVRSCILAGAAGVSVGRNIFQADDPKLAMSKVRDTVLAAVREVGGLEILS